ncbi:MAG: tetratricopeptide repeat protein [Pirellulaceae bacterium]|nr:tetratricopeptide repeat protein [Pirellulaceae bacterium]
MVHRRQLWLCAACLAAFAAIVAVPCVPAAAQSASDAPRESELPAPLVPKTPRTEADEDRLHAAALYAHGRLLQGRGDLAGALARYQRAWRYDPTQLSVLREIAPLAFELKRSDEAGRYAVLAAEFEPTDAVLLRRLAQYLTEQRDWKRALSLYEKSLAADPPTPGEPLDLAAATVQFEMGRLYFLIDDFVRSAACFARVREALADPASPLSAESKDVLLGKPAQTYGLWGETFLAAQRYDEAAALFAQQAAAGGDKSALAHNLARVAAARPDRETALARLDEYFAAKTDTAGTEPYELLVKLLADKHADKAEAARLATERLAALHQADADNAPLAQVLAGQYFAAGKLAEATRLYAAVLAARPTGEAYRRLIEIHRRRMEYAELLAVAGRLVKEVGSLTAVESALQPLVADRAALEALLAAARRQVQDPQNPAPAEVAQAAGLIAIAGQNNDAADEFFAVALAAKDSQPAKLLEAWGLALLQANQHERAARVFRRMLEENQLPSGEASVQFYLAGALAMIGKTDEALACAERAAELDPENPRFGARIGFVLAHARRWDAARRAELALLKRYDSRHDNAQARRIAAEARRALSNIDLARGDFPSAVEWLEQILDEFPDDPGAGNDLGYLWAERGQHLARSLALIQRAVAAEPENVAYRDSLGWVLFQLGRHAEAERELAQAASSADADGVILDHWGDALAKLGRSAEARAAWERAAAAIKGSGDAAKLPAIQRKLKAP